MKLFFRMLRAVLGPVLLLKEQLTKPKGLVRAAAEQKKIDRECESLALYQFSTCPFCIKVRQEIRRLSLNIAQRDAQHIEEHKQALLAQGGSAKVPCLQIKHDDGTFQWLYESSDIIRYLQQRFAATV
ncbi:glutathione S-transferase N-terminal domain-containing protein [Undibacterium sp. SXout7W]|uniref:glutathione S-transferase N-terminal domain-containing protein n=1 Tax=Undibacterium sp. SXout7W TaxID=3413049 RepID=UPI003BF1BD44